MYVYIHAHWSSRNVSLYFDVYPRLRYRARLYTSIARTRVCFILLSFLLSFFPFLFFLFARTIHVLTRYATSSHVIWVGSNAVADVMKQDSERVQTRATIAHVVIIQLETNRNWSAIVYTWTRNTQWPC